MCLFCLQVVCLTPAIPLLLFKWSCPKWTRGCQLDWMHSACLSRLGGTICPVDVYRKRTFVGFFFWRRDFWSVGAPGCFFFFFCVCSIQTCWLNLGRITVEELNSHSLFHTFRIVKVSVIRSERATGSVVSVTTTAHHHHHFDKVCRERPPEASNQSLCSIGNHSGQPWWCRSGRTNRLDRGTRRKVRLQWFHWWQVFGGSNARSHQWIHEAAVITNFRGFAHFNKLLRIFRSSFPPKSHSFSFGQALRSKILENQTLKRCKTATPNSIQAVGWSRGARNVRTLRRSPCIRTG
jgi:hypothetical protein